jgi:gliding motility-associated-like protein
LLANLGAGAYQVNITDANNCSVSANFSVELNNSFIVSVDPPVSTIQYQESVLLDVTIVPDVPGATYSWSPIAGLSCTDCPNPIAAPISNTTYTVTVTAPNGCTQTAQATVNVQLPCGAAFMPTIFSPNGDNLNDELCLMGSCVQTMTYSIYNKWGELVFSSNKQSDCWDGTFRGKPAPMGGYAYKLQVTLTDGTIQEESGNITLAR